MAWPGQTSEQAGGERAGRPVRFEQADLDAVRAEANLVKSVDPRRRCAGCQIAYGDRMANTAVRGV